MNLKKIFYYISNLYRRYKRKSQTSKLLTCTLDIESGEQLYPFMDIALNILTEKDFVDIGNERLYTLEFRSGFINAYHMQQYLRNALLEASEGTITIRENISFDRYISLYDWLKFDGRNLSPWEAYDILRTELKPLIQLRDKVPESYFNRKTQSIQRAFIGLTQTLIIFIQTSK